VLVVAEGDPPENIVLLRDNFTGAALRRLISARKNEPNSFAAVMDRSGRFAHHSDGHIYDPIEETKGRKGGTDADRGYRAYCEARALFREMNGYSYEDARKPPKTVAEQMFWTLMYGIGFWVFFGLIVKIFG
jgi:hypothetical protein